MLMTHLDYFFWRLFRLFVVGSRLHDAQNRVKINANDTFREKGNQKSIQITLSTFHDYRIMNVV